MKFARRFFSPTALSVVVVTILLLLGGTFPSVPKGKASSSAAVVLAFSSSSNVAFHGSTRRRTTSSSSSRLAFCPARRSLLEPSSSVLNSSYGDYDSVGGGFRDVRDDGKPVLNRRLKRRTNRATIAFSKQLKELAQTPRRCPPKVAYSAAKSADDSLRSTMEDIRTGKETEIALNVVVFTTVLRAWERASAAGVKGAADSSLELLQLMERLSDAGDDLVQPDVLAYGSVVNALAKASRNGEKGAAGRAQEVLEDMIDRHLEDEDGFGRPMPNGIIYNTVISAWANSANPSNPEGADRAEDLLRRMTREYEATGNPELKPDLRTYSGVINAYGRSGRKDGAERAEALLEEMERRAEEEGETELSPDTVAYNSVVNAYARLAARSADRRKGRGTSGGNEAAVAAADRAFAVLRRMEASDSFRSKPDARTYSSVLQSLANAGGPLCAVRAVELLDEMTTKSQSSDPSLRPDAFSYTSAVRAAANSGEDDAADRALEVLGRMSYPTTAAYNAAIDALAKRGGGTTESAERAEGLLAKMEGKDVASASEWDVDAEMGLDGDEDARPNAITYTSVINAWAGAARNGDEDAPLKAEGLLDRLISKYEHSDNDRELKPDAMAFASTIKAWADSTLDETKGERAESLLRRMMDDHGLPPNAAAYALTIKARSTGKARDPEKAEALLREMSGHGLRVAPSVTGMVVAAWSYVGGSECAHRAEKLLREYEGQLNEAAHGMVVRALAEAGGDGDVERAEALLGEWEGQYEQSSSSDGDSKRQGIKAMKKPDEETYRAVVNALEKAGEEERARQVFWRMQEL